jgi:hypothetical protein
MRSRSLLCGPREDRDANLVTRLFVGSSCGIPPWRLGISDQQLDVSSHLGADARSYLLLCSNILVCPHCLPPILFYQVVVNALAESLVSVLSYSSV